MSLPKTNHHIPVLLQEVMDAMDPNRGDLYLDLTAGYGGHASRILDITKSKAVLVDRDKNAIEELNKLFKDYTDLRIINKDYLSACRVLKASKNRFDLILVDLGVSSPHLDDKSRGFSIRDEGPLDMRMDRTQKLTAADVVNTYEKQELTEVLQNYGEEPKAKLMAHLIAKNRPLKSTTDLVSIAKKAWPGRSKTHPATRLFQAIRIEVNQELAQLEQALPIMVDLLNEGGRLGIISFHSLEDRIVKKFFKEKSGDRYDAELQELTKRPITSKSNELAYNPRARSAKMRVVVKIKTKTEGKGYYADSG